MARSSLQAIGSRGNITTVLMVLLLMLGVGCSLMFGPEMNLSATLGTDGCRSVESAGHAWSFRGVEFRSSARGPSELYFATTLNDGRGPYSEFKNAIQFHSSAPLRRVTEAEWAAAQIMPRGEISVAGEGVAGDSDNHDLFISGKRFARSGEHLALATASATGQRIAVYSYDGQQRMATPGSILVPGQSKHPTKGKAYVDVFDVTSGRKVLALAGPFRGEIPTHWFLRSLFIGDSYFFFGTDAQGDAVQSFWVCEVKRPEDPNPPSGQR
jgi:hypothetical protein